LRSSPCMPRAVASCRIATMLSTLSLNASMLLPRMLLLKKRKLIRRCARASLHPYIFLKFVVYIDSHSHPFVSCRDLLSLKTRARVKTSENRSFVFVFYSSILFYIENYEYNNNKSISTGNEGVGQYLMLSRSYRSHVSLSMPTSTRLENRPLISCTLPAG
jgi:hypothetical protein